MVWEEDKCLVMGEGVPDKRISGSLKERYDLSKVGDVPVVQSERRTSADTGNSHRSCLPGHGQQKCAAGAC